MTKRRTKKSRNTKRKNVKRNLKRTYKKGGFGWFWNKKQPTQKIQENSEEDMIQRDAVIADENVLEDIRGYRELERKDDNEMKEEEKINKQISNINSKRATQNLNKYYEVENSKQLWDEDDLRYYEPIKRALTEKKVGFSELSQVANIDEPAEYEEINVIDDNLEPVLDENGNPKKRRIVSNFTPVSTKTKGGKKKRKNNTKKTRKNRIKRKKY